MMKIKKKDALVKTLKNNLSLIFLNACFKYFKIFLSESRKDLFS